MTRLLKLLERMRQSGQSEAITIGECIQDGLEDCSDSETLPLAAAMADEFIGWAEQLKLLNTPDDALCYPPHHDPAWRLCEQATNAWLGTVEDRTGKEIFDLSAWAVQDFAAAFRFAKDFVIRHNRERYGIYIPDY